MYLKPISSFVQRLISLSKGVSVSLMGWTVIEPGMYLIAACLLALRPILRKLSPKEITTRLRGFSGLLRKSDNSRSDDTHGIRNKARPVKSSNSGFIELQSRHDIRSAIDEITIPPSTRDVDLSLRQHDLEEGVKSPERHIEGAEG